MTNRLFTLTLLVLFSLMGTGCATNCKASNSTTGGRILSVTATALPVVTISPTDKSRESLPETIRPAIGADVPDPTPTPYESNDTLPDETSGSVTSAEETRQPVQSRENCLVASGTSEALLPVQGALIFGSTNLAGLTSEEARMSVYEYGSVDQFHILEQESQQIVEAAVASFSDIIRLSLGGDWFGYTDWIQDGETKRERMVLFSAEGDILNKMLPPSPLHPSYIFRAFHWSYQNIMQAYLVKPDGGRWDNSELVLFDPFSQTFIEWEAPPDYEQTRDYWAAKFSPGLRYLFWGDVERGGGTMRIWDTREQRVVWEGKNETTGVSPGLVWALDENAAVITSYYSFRILKRDERGNLLELFVIEHTGRKEGLATVDFHSYRRGWSPDGTRFAYIEDDSLKVYDLATEIPYTLCLFQTRIVDFTWSPDGDQIAIVSWVKEENNHKLSILTLESLEPVRFVTQDVLEMDRIHLIGWSQREWKLHGSTVERAPFLAAPTNRP